VYIHKQKYSAYFVVIPAYQIILNHIEIKKAKKGWKNNCILYIVLRIAKSVKSVVKRICEICG